MNETLQPHADKLWMPADVRPFFYGDYEVRLLDGSVRTVEYGWKGWHRTDIRNLAAWAMTSSQVVTLLAECNSAHDQLQDTRSDNNDWVRCDECLPPGSEVVDLWDGESQAIGWMPYWNTGKPTKHWAFPCESWEQDEYKPTHWRKRAPPPHEPAATSTPPAIKDKP